MSLPKDLLDQLLSGYLDDALSADERVRVEQLLQSNAEVAEELEQLRSIRRSLRALSRMDSGVKLDRGFADRVLGAAVARAHEEGLDEDHPLVRLAEQPSTSSSPAALPRSRWPIAAVMVGLAASIVLAVLLLRPAQGPTPGGNSIAQSDTEAMHDDAIPTAPGPTLPERIEEPAGVVEPGPMLVEADQGAVDGLASNQAASRENTVTSGDMTTVKPDSDVSVDAAPSPTESMVASNTKPAPAENQTESLENVPPVTQMGAILVVEVVRSESGIADDAVGKAMRAADLDPSSRKEVTEPITGFVGEDVDTRLDGASVFYLDVPGKQLDLLYQKLWADEEGIESVRMALAMSAPLLQVVNAVRPDPTTVRHEADVYELFSQSGVVDQLATELSQLPFPAADRSRGAAASLSSGPDIQTQVLLLVR